MRSAPFAGRTCLVTGGGQGMGRAFVLELLRQGAAVATCDIDAASLVALRSHETATNARLLALVADVADPQARAAFFETVVRELGPIDLLVNNAGVAVGGPVTEITAADWDWIRAINLDAPFDFIRRVLPDMQRRGRGEILNVASIAGLTAQPFVSPYVATKHALVGLSRSLHHELAPYGITVTAACPGIVKTGIFDRVRTRGLDLEQVRWIFALSISPETAVSRMLRALRRRQVVTIPNWGTAVAYLFCRLWPSLADGVVAWAAHRGLRAQRARAELAVKKSD